ncbi:MAG: zinc metallopeptidase [Acidobacteriota bacterium]|nr:zinc metallopeptidase [Acidobacteriota bacterium]MDH3528739.1 zinc metallopeptidase [Acidobacteriota bacterium]
MRWRDQRRSTNVEDRRGMSGRGIAIGGGGIGVIVLVIAVILCGGDPRSLLEQMPQQNQPTQQQPQARQNGKTDENSEFVSVVLGSTEDVWNDVFRKSGIRYKEPKLVLFTGQVRSACGFADAAMGPFYCPGDQKLYLDFAFFGELEREFKAPGDFAQAYVIAHEVGHHVQNLLGTMDKVTSAQRSAGKSEANRLSVRLELQADCFAGIWAAEANRKGLVEAGDAEEAIRAAQAVGDDMIQKRTRGYVVPDSFTHGTARERATWFATGFKSGDVKQCRTFE